MADRSKLGTALSGMGAGFMGRGAEWNYYQDRARMEQQEIERQRDLLQRQQVLSGLYKYKSLMESGQPSMARDVLMDGLASGVMRDQWNEYAVNHDAGKFDLNLADIDATLGAAQIEGLADMVGGAGGDVAAVAEFKFKTEGLTPEQVQEAKLVDLGLSPRAAGLRTTNIGGIVHTVDPNTNEARPLVLNGKPVTVDMVGQNAATIKGYETGASGAQELGKETLNELRSMTSRIRQYEAARNALERGADSGQIAERFPTLFEPTATLENIRNQLGINLIGATTFGNLSEGELQFALATMMPQGLDQKELGKWLERKIAADRKLQKELRRAATYLTRPETTLNDFLKEFNVTYGGSENSEPPPGFVIVQ